MQEFITKAASQLGLTQSATETATGGVLKFIKDQAGGADFKELLNKVPGADAMLKKAPRTDGGGLLGKALSAFGGGSGGSALGLGAMLQGAGLGLDKISGFVPMLMGYFKEKAGSAAIGNILGKIPELKQLAG